MNLACLRSRSSIISLQLFITKLPRVTIVRRGAERTLRAAGRSPRAPFVGGGLEVERRNEAKRNGLPWKNAYRFVEPGITADCVPIYPFDRSFPIDVSFERISRVKHVRLNRHEFFEVIYIYAGPTQIQVRDRLFPAKAG